MAAEHGAHMGNIANATIVLTYNPHRLTVHRTAVAALKTAQQEDKAAKEAIGTAVVDKCLARID